MSHLPKDFMLASASQVLFKLEYSIYGKQADFCSAN
jgi:hypothetical protein